MSVAGPIRSILQQQDRALYQVKKQIKEQGSKAVVKVKENPTGGLQFGVVAQEIETVSAGLVQENEEGIKSVKYSVLYMKAVKCLQEAIAKIEVLETKVAALEAA